VVKVYVWAITFKIMKIHLFLNKLVITFLSASQKSNNLAIGNLAKLQNNEYKKSPRREIC